jgi:uncharacterized iron-regulated protein
MCFALRRFVLFAILSTGFAAPAVLAAPKPMARVDTALSALCPDAADALPATKAAVGIWTPSGELAALKDRLNAATVAVLGEIHDNADHHRVQACLLALFAAGRKPAVVWEQINETQSDALRAYWAREDRTAAGLGSAVGWAKSGWPAWEIYQPIAEVAAARDLAMYAGNISRTKVMGVARGGLETLDADTLNELRVVEPLPEAERKALLDVLVASHCGLMPASAFGPMALAQNLRDGWMARAVRTAVSEHGTAVLITGNGHAHRSRGVPFYFARQAPELEAPAVVSIIVEESDTPDAFPAAAVPVQADGSDWAADIVITTRPAKREDPCVAMRKRFGGAKRQGAD